MVDGEPGEFAVCLGENPVIPAVEPESLIPYLRKI